MPSEKIACRFLTFNYNSTLVINKILSYEKKSLKNDGQQFHQYLTHAKRSRPMTLKIYVLDWDRHKNVADFDRLRYI